MKDILSTEAIELLQRLVKNHIKELVEADNLDKDEFVLALSISDVLAEGGDFSWEHYGEEMFSIGKWKDYCIYFNTIQGSADIYCSHPLFSEQLIATIHIKTADEVEDWVRQHYTKRKY